MRSYAVNSPEAVNRLLALAALADGHVSKVELEALEAAGAEATGAPGAVMRGVLHGLCEDLMMADPLHWDGIIRLDPELRMSALRLGLRVAHADQHLHEAESQLLLDAMGRWGMLDQEPSPAKS
jgi:uncharacterized tellurite resistance protein B-like protein